MQHPFPIVTKENAHCLDCYRCLRKCAIDAIDFSTGRAHIIQDKCVVCGECVSECPQHTKKIITDMPRVIKALEEKRPLALSLGGMLVTYFGCLGPEGVMEKAYKIGFKVVEPVDVIEPLVLAEIASYLRRNEGKFTISSHCPTIVNLIEQHYAHLIPNLLPYPSLAMIHARELKKQHPECEVVHVTACPGEFHNRDTLNSVDYLITFNDFEQLLRYMKSDVGTVPPGPLAPNKGGYGYTVIGNMASQLLNDGVLVEGHTEWYSGLTNCINILDGLHEDDLPDVQFLELMSCNSGCISGLGMEKKGSILDRCLCLERYYHAREDWPVRVLETDIPRTSFVDRTYVAPPVSKEAVAQEMRSFYEQQGAKILNCGACGYNSCYDKSVAVVRGEADRNMCMSYMKAKAETLANAIVSSSDSGIMVFDAELRILQTNPRLRRMFSGYDLCEGRLLTDYMDGSRFRPVVEKDKVMRNSLQHYEDLDLWTQETVQPMEGVADHYLALFTDVTEQVNQRRELEGVKQQLLVKADEVINEQMRVAQEIASLLGETTSATKITLLKLINEFEREKELT